MNEKKLDLNKSLYELCSDNPGITKLLEAIGFHDITKPGMLQTAGRYMTIPKGAKMKRIDLKTVKQTFTEHGYKIEEGST